MGAILLDVKKRFFGDFVLFVHFVYQGVQSLSFELSYLFQMGYYIFHTNHNAASRERMLVISPVDVTNGPIMLFGSWPFLNKYTVAKKVNGISIAFAIMPAINGTNI